ncbi:hypothetical protein [Nodosilinea sp. LEGE 07088]|nr:hypothetical protein [Nodosilinea sp. LEGE 07088]
MAILSIPVGALLLALLLLSSVVFLAWLFPSNTSHIPKKKL